LVVRRTFFIYCRKYFRAEDDEQHETLISVGETPTDREDAPKNGVN